MACLCAAGAFGQSVFVPNASFESPPTPFVTINVDSWEKTPQPASYDGGGGYQWVDLVGEFLNTPAGAPDHLDNCDGNQAIWVFAVPQAGMFQDYDSIDWSHTNAAHAFNATYDVGRYYTMTVGVNGGGGNMLPGATLQLSLYYRDSLSNHIVVAAASVTNSAVDFPIHTHLFDYQVQTPTVQPGDPWAGQHIGIEFLSNVGTNLAGGYWDLDNVRLTASPLFDLAIGPATGGVEVSWPSVSGWKYQAQMSIDLQSWTNRGVSLAGTGSPLQILLPGLTNAAGAFVRVVASGL